MKGSQTAILIGAGILTFMLFSKTASARTYDGLDLDFLSKFGADDVQRLQDLADELSTRGLSDQTIKYMLSQALQETGIFTDNSANYNAVDNKHNYAGISYNGQIASYGSIPDFVDDWIRVLSKSPNYPINATSIQDYNSRLKANGYYTDSAATYGNNLNYYFNLLNQ